jgi:hypothetical protein
MDDARAARARARAHWPGAVTTLVGQADAAIVRHGTASERIAMVWRITLDAFASAGLPLPSYSRADMPGRVLRASDHGVGVEAEA